MRLQQFLKERYPSLSGKKIKERLDLGLCRINGKVEKRGGFLVPSGARVELDEPPLLESTFTPERILHEDDSLLFYNKPAGLLSEPASFPGLHLVHRLDKMTTGVLLLAKSPEIAKEIEELFRLREMKKIYWALVEGAPSQKEGTLTAPLGIIKEGSSLPKRGVTPSGQSARTDWTLLKKGKEAALLACTPWTGRTHQIRLHLQALGHPIIGDHTYNPHGHHKAPYPLLHAKQLSFTWKGKHYQVEAPVPALFQQFLSELAT